jgi:hypothetical protein
MRIGFPTSWATAGSRARSSRAKVIRGAANKKPRGDTPRRGLGHTHSRRACMGSSIQARAIRQAHPIGQAICYLSWGVLDVNRTLRSLSLRPRSRLLVEPLGHPFPLFGATFAAPSVMFHYTCRRLPKGRSVRRPRSRPRRAAKPRPAGRAGDKGGAPTRRVVCRAPPALGVARHGCIQYHAWTVRQPTRASISPPSFPPSEAEQVVCQGTAGAESRAKTGGSPRQGSEGSRHWRRKDTRLYPVGCGRGAGSFSLFLRSGSV